MFASPDYTDLMKKSLQGAQPKVKANRLRGSWVTIGHTNKQTEITTIY